MRLNITAKNINYDAINVIQAGYIDCRKSAGYGPAIRTFWVFHFIESGFGIFRINGKEYSVGPGEILVIPPYVETYYEADSHNPWSYSWICFTVPHQLPLELPDVINCPSALRIFTSIKSADNLENGRNAFLISKTWELFSLLLENEDHGVDYVDQVLDCIHCEYMHDLTIQKIAERLCLGHSYLTAIFKKRVGITPKQYLLNHRMSIAAFLITEKNLNISVAANSVGYTDIYNFSKMFKKHFKVSPREYVKQRKDTDNSKK
jgi:AraC-like DNA-binding protein